jgi:hypothetical protein
MVLSQYIAIGTHHYILTNNGITRDGGIDTYTGIVSYTYISAGSEIGFSLYMYIFSALFKNMPTTPVPQETCYFTQKRNGITWQKV